MPQATSHKILLVGPAGCGKTHKMLDEFEDALRHSDPLAPDIFFIVPSAEHTERVVSVLVQRGIKGFFHRRVTTLSRLAAEVFRVDDIPVASSIARLMAVKEVFAELDPEYFRAVRDQPGFLDLVLQFISELKESRVGTDEFRSRMNGLKKFEPAFGAKYEALAAIYESYQTKLKARGLRDQQDALTIFLERQAKGRAAGPRFKALWFDGFFDFSSLQLEYINILASAADAMTVTLTKEDGPGREETFGIAHATQKNLEAIGFKLLKMKPDNFRTRPSDLLYLQKNIFLEKKGPSPFSQKGKADGPPVTFLDAVGTEGEIELIAREIRKLYSGGGYRYSDFAVLFRQIRDYGRVISSIFSRYGIPAEIHERERLKFSPWISVPATLLSIFKDRWRREDVLSFLRSGYVRRFGNTEKDEAWLAEFEIRAYREGILEGREAWLRPWGRPEKVPDDERFNALKEKILAPLTILEDRFRAAQRIQEHIRLFDEAVCRTFGVPDIPDENTALTLRDAASFRRFRMILDELRENLRKAGAAAVAFETFADQFLGLVGLDVYPLHERDKNRVQVYDVSLARQKEYKVVFVAGLLEKVFPIQIREDALLSDWERQLVNGDGKGHLLQERLPRQTLERYLFYLAVTRSSEKLFLSCPRFDLEGKESLPSFYLEEARELLGDRMRVVRQELSRPYPSQEEAATRREREAAFVGELCAACERGQADSFSKNLPVPSSSVLRDAGSRQRVLTAFTPVEAEIRDPKIREGKFFELKEASPTRLEEYAKCPFRYFAHRILELQDPVEDRTGRDKGTILHWVLEEYFKRLIAVKGEEVPVGPFTEQKLREAFEKFPLVSERKYREELDRAEVREMLLSVLENEMERLGISDLTPLYLEYEFGAKAGASSPALELRKGKKPLKIQGRIDRIDSDPEKKLALVVDYKRSARFDRSGLELGVALQLPLYLLAVEKHLGLKPVGGEIYSLKDGKRSGFYQKEEAEKLAGEFNKKSFYPGHEFRKVLDRTVAFVERFSDEIEGLRIVVRPRDCETFCPYSAVCRIEKWRLPAILQEIREEDVKQSRDSGLSL